uniref:Uncharacterized protein n=1 Tax=Lactuca sativa TaxID=4236 RepID=A0A9R1XAZ8_LACSA|nr:hypothetical protein LSAT_V11C500280480 [Lactuca sativa]
MMGHLSVKASCHKLHEVFSRLNEPMRDLFSTTSFSYLLDLPAQSGDELLIYELLLHMLRPIDETDAIERLYFRFSRRTLSFGPEEFCLVTELYMGRCPTSRIEFSTMFSWGSYLWTKIYPRLSGMFKKFEDHMSNHPTKAIVYTLSGFVIPLKVYLGN